MPTEAGTKPDHDAAFAAALLKPDMPTPEPVTAASGKGANKRYDVYRNNVTSSLVNALADIFPATQKITGETNFRAVAREHVRAHPPTSPLLFRYGEDFADFLETIEPVRQKMPYLGDVARVERAWLTAFHAADEPVMAPEDLAAIPQENLGDAIFVPHPATAVVRSEFAIYEIFAMNRGFSELKPIDLRVAQSVLVTRPQADVATAGVDPATGLFLATLIERAPLGVAASRAMETDGTFDLGAALTIALQSGAFSAVSLSTHQEQEEE